MKKRLLRAFMAAALIVAMVVTGSVVASAAFKDVTEYEEAIDTLNELGIIRGHSSTIFAPKDDIKRVHMALLISKLCTGKVETSVWQEAIDAKTFSDISNDPGKNHYPTAILYAVNNGIIKGMGDGTFAPDANIQVDQACAMIVRCLNYPTTSLDKGDWSANYMQKADDLGLFEGVDELKYSPTKVLNRGQVAQMLFNALHAPIYGSSQGQTYAQKNFNISSGTKMVLVATNMQSLVAGVQKTSLPNYVVMAELNPDGTYGAKHTIKATDIGLVNSSADKELGVTYVIQCEKTTGATEKVVSYKRVAPMETLRNGVTFGTSQNTMTYKNVTYSLVSSYTYDLVDGKAPNKRQVVLYCANLTNTVPTTASSYYSVITRGSDLAGKGAYELRPFDDNGDGYIDRAIFTPYTVGQYKNADAKVTVTVAGSKVIERNTGVISVSAPSGQTLKNGDFIMYFYNPQTMTLEICDVLDTQKGTVMSNNSTGLLNTVNISVQSTYGTQTQAFIVGHESMPGATRADVLKVAENLLTPGSQITFAYTKVNDAYYLIAVDTTAGQGVQYESQYQTVVVKDIHAADNTKENVALNGMKLTVYTVGVLGSEKVINVTYYSKSGSSVFMNQTQLANAITATSDVSAQVQVGDILELPYANIAQTGYAINITNKPSFSVGQSQYAMLGHAAATGFSPVGTLTLNSFSAALQAKTWSTDSETIVVKMTQSSTGTKVELLPLQTMSLNAGESVYISYGGGTTSTYKPVKMVYIRPTPVTNANPTGVFDKIVYLSPEAIATVQTLPDTSSGTFVYHFTYKDAIDMITGQKITVTYSIAMSGTVPTISKQGYYKVSGTKIVDATPITSDVTSGTLAFKAFNGNAKIVAGMLSGQPTYKYAVQVTNASVTGTGQIVAYANNINIFSEATLPTVNAGTGLTMNAGLPFNYFDNTTGSYATLAGGMSAELLLNSTTKCYVIWDSTKQAITVIHVLASY